MGDQLAPAVPTGSEPGRRQAQKTAAVKGPPADDLEEEEPAQIKRKAIYFDRWDLIAALFLTAVAFVLRFSRAHIPDFFLHPSQGTGITNGLPSAPVDAKGDPGTICGLAYPFNRGYPDSNGVLSPPNGQVFDEIYFPVDAYDDTKGIELCKPRTVSC